MTIENHHNIIEPKVGVLLTSGIENPMSVSDVFAGAGDIEMKETSQAKGNYKTESSSTQDVLREPPSELTRFERFYKEGVPGKISQYLKDRDDFAPYLDTGPKMRRRGAEELLQNLRKEVMNSMFMICIPDYTTREEILFRDFYHLDMDEISGIVEANPGTFSALDLEPIYRYNAFIDRILNILFNDDLPPFGEQLMEHINKSVEKVKPERRMDYLMGWVNLIRMAKDLKVVDEDGQVNYLLAEPPFSDFKCQFVCHVIHHIKSFYFEESYSALEIAMSLGFDKSTTTVKNYINEKFDGLEQNVVPVIERLFKLQLK